MNALMQGWGVGAGAVCFGSALEPEPLEEKKQEPEPLEKKSQEPEPKQLAGSSALLEDKM